MAANILQPAMPIEWSTILIRDGEYEYSLLIVDVHHAKWEPTQDLLTNHVVNDGSGLGIISNLLDRTIDFGKEGLVSCSINNLTI